MALKIVCDRCGKDIIDGTDALVRLEILDEKDRLPIEPAKLDLCRSCGRDVRRLIREAPARSAGHD